MAESQPKPRVFIGSSREGLPIAEAIQTGLDYDAEVTIWSQGVFGLSTGTLESLVRASGDYDFAVLVLTPDDLTQKRDVSGNSPRDNVIFELGLFMGARGRERTFAVYCRDKELDLPSDLAGVTLADYGNRTDGNLQAALGPACTKIKNAIAATFQTGGKSQPQNLHAKVASPLKSRRSRSAMDLKILNTLWIWQVVKFPSLVLRFTFRIELASAEESARYETSSVGFQFEGLVFVTAERQLGLTDAGLAYCRSNFETFPSDAWFDPPPELPATELAQALAAIPTP
jgi:hypothetical protein